MHNPTGQNTKILRGNLVENWGTGGSPKFHHISTYFLRVLYSYIRRVSNHQIATDIFGVTKTDLKLVYKTRGKDVEIWDLKLNQQQKFILNHTLKYVEFWFNKFHLNYI